MKLSQKSVGVAKKERSCLCCVYVSISGEPPRGYIDLYMSTYNGLLLCSLIESRQLQILSYQDHSNMYIYSSGLYISAAGGDRYSYLSFFMRPHRCWFPPPLSFSPKDDHTHVIAPQKISKLKKSAR
jgi:hypothetical protein